MTEVKLDLDGLEALSLKATDTLREGRVSQATMTELLRAGFAAQHPKPIKLGAPVEDDAAYLTALANSAPALLALAREAEGQGWRDIESAPRDGTEVSVLIKPKVIRLGWYFAPSSRTEGWCDENGRRIRPTHWMPLPTPPSRTQSGEDA